MTNAPENKFARQFLALHPSANAVLVDHRGHGDSPRGDAFGPPHTVEACARDTLQLMDHLQRQGVVRSPPKVVVGHSFGGKVALAFRGLVPTTPLTWVLDSPPGAGALSERGDSVVRLLKTLQSMPRPPPNRADLVRILAAERGFSTTVANWMTTNVKTNADGSSEWVFDLAVAHDLIADYQLRDMLPQVEATASPSSRVGFIKAGLNKHWPEHNLEALRAAARRNPQGILLVEMPGVGHFLHTDKPKEVMDIMRDSVASALMRAPSSPPSFN